MAEVNTRQLIDRLNSFCRKSLDGAIGLAAMNHHGGIEIEHWLTKLLEEERSDLRLILEEYQLDPVLLSSQLTRALERIRPAGMRQPTISPHILDAVREAWLIASIDYRSATVHSGHLLMALISDRWLKPIVEQIAPCLLDIPGETLRSNYLTIVRDSLEEKEELRQTAPRSGEPGQGVGQLKSDTPGLDQFTVDLTKQAQSGKIDPVVGRDAEIRQLIDILMRRRQNNPVLVGEAGVGKTAVVEGFALRIAHHDVPPPLLNVSVRSLDLGLLQAGASVRGELENRLRTIITEVRSSPQPIILFVDEAHLLIGGNEGAGLAEAANLLKPALARGELRTIAATTWSEYKKYFDKDAAMVRRFQMIKIEEPDDEVAMQMLRSISENLKNHHGVDILESGIKAAVSLSKRYLSERQLPDKAVSVLDTACARVALSQSTTPAQLEDIERSIDHLDLRIRESEKQVATGELDPVSLEDLRTRRAQFDHQWQALNSRWDVEKDLIERILAQRGHLTGETEEPKQAETTEEASSVTIESLRSLERQLRELQGPSPLVKPYIDDQAVAEVIASWTGIPVGRMVSDEVEMLMNLDGHLRQRVVGQDHALELVSEQVRISRANLADPSRPVGVFLLVGPSGVGKTETAMALADLLYGGKQNLTVLNMSEFKEEHKVSMLTGSPAGYVGYGQGGILTEAVRRHPFSVLLLDEIEKANPQIHDVFYQVFDKGMLRDGEGRDIDFKNTLIIMTSNAASEVIKNVCADPETAPAPDQLRAMLHEHLLESFKPAFLGRATILPYFPLSTETLTAIARLQLDKVKSRVQVHYNASFSYTSDVIEMILSRCNEVDSGARIINQIISNTILPHLAKEFIHRTQVEEPFRQVCLTINSTDGRLVCQIE